MQRLASRLLFFIFLTHLSSSAYGWWDAGHEIVAQIAWAGLTSQAQLKVRKILESPLNDSLSSESSVRTQGNGLGPSQGTQDFQTLFSLTQQMVLASLWPDLIKMRSMRFKKTLDFQDPYGSACHFLPLNFDSIEFQTLSQQLKSPRTVQGARKQLKQRVQAAKKLSPKNILVCLEQAIEALSPLKTASDSLTNSGMASVALRYLVHLVGDLHQPLHNFSVNHDQGGNRTPIVPQKIQFYSKKRDIPASFVSQLHSFWDAMLGTTFQLTVIPPTSGSLKTHFPDFEGHLEYSKKLADGILRKKYVKRLKGELLKQPSDHFEQWSADAIELGINMTQSFYHAFLGDPNARHRPLEPFQSPGDRRRIEKQLLLAGVRLGQILNQLFDPNSKVDS